MPLYRCHFLDSMDSVVEAKVAAENDAEAIRIARSISTITGPGWFELWQAKRSVVVEAETMPPLPTVPGRPV
jgi:hypothetical protein